MTLGEAVSTGAARLADAGIDSPRQEARLLLALAAELDPAIVLGYPERVLAPAACERFAALLARRALHEPYARLAGRREFWSLDFAVTADTLDPRPDSETVVAAALQRITERDAALRVLDLGTGTGCLLLSLLKELPNALGVGVDISPGAVLTARANAASISLESRSFFAVGDWAAGLAGRFDIVLANPPYIASDAIAALAPEVARFEPRRALDGGADGLCAYRVLAAQLPRLIAPAGFAALEVGADQAMPAERIFAFHGLEVQAVHRDLSGIERCLVVTPGPETGAAR